MPTIFPRARRRLLRHLVAVFAVLAVFAGPLLSAEPAHATGTLCFPNDGPGIQVVSSIYGPLIKWHVDYTCDQNAFMNIDYQNVRVHRSPPPHWVVETVNTANNAGCNCRTVSLTTFAQCVASPNQFFWGAYSELVINNQGLVNVSINAAGRYFYCQGAG